MPDTITDPDPLEPVRRLSIRDLLERPPDSVSDRELIEEVCRRIGWDAEDTFQLHLARRQAHRALMRRATSVVARLEILGLQWEDEDLARENADEPYDSDWMEDQCHWRGLDRRNWRDRAQALQLGIDDARWAGLAELAGLASPAGPAEPKDRVISRLLEAGRRWDEVKALAPEDARLVLLGVLRGGPTASAASAAAVPVAPHEPDPPTGARLTFDEQTWTVTLDGVSYHVDDPKAFLVYRAIAEAEQQPVTNATIRSVVRGVAGRKAIRRQLDRLPPALLETISTNTTGHCLVLPQKRR